MTISRLRAPIVRGAVVMGASIAVACSNQPGQAKDASVSGAWAQRPNDDRLPASPALPRPALTDTVAVSAGRYPIGRNDGPTSQRPAHSVTLAAFRIDRTEVTNAAFAQFLNGLRLAVRGSFAPGEITARNGNLEAVRLLSTPRDIDRSSSFIELDDGDARIELRNGRFSAVPGFEQHPVTEVTWAGARAFCRSRGADLPTEAQWEAAARGRDDRRFPWGDAAPDANRARIGGSVGSTAPVGSRSGGTSPFGALDMAGSLAEWTSSLKLPYPYSADDGREAVDSPGERTTRGGDYEYDSQPINYSVSFRDGFSNDPRHGHRHVGVRCGWNGALG